MINQDIKGKAESGDPVAMFELSKEYLREAKEKGKKGKMDEDCLTEALKWLQESALKGNAEAQHEMADVCRGEEDFEWSFKFEKMASDQGYTDAYHNLAFHYENGIGTDVDSDMAFHWYSKAAESGNADDKGSLGRCYFVGLGTQQDFEKAFSLLDQAANEGSATAKRILGVAYMEGLMRLTANKEKGRTLLQEAANLGDQEAVELLKQKKYR